MVGLVEAVAWGLLVEQLMIEGVSGEIMLWIRGRCWEIVVTSGEEDLLKELSL